ncbi:MAG: hypothetical protein MI724_13285 [Spirochaetales bacterium]|nr:hypothetical protein [Spirochaetales bacterium]
MGGSLFSILFLSCVTNRVPDTTLEGAPAVDVEGDAAFPLADGSGPEEAETADTAQPTVVEEPVHPGGTPLEDVFAPLPGMRLEYALFANDEDTGRRISLVMQPSRAARADLSVHGEGFEGFAVMDEGNALWYPTRTAIDSVEAALLAALPWPRFLPGDGEAFLFSRDLLDGRAHMEPLGGEEGWAVTYAIAEGYRRDLSGEATSVLSRFEAEPGTIPAGGPRTIRYSGPDAIELRFELQSAVVRRQRSIEGVVVGGLGSPLSGFAVAPHPAVGRLDPSLVARTNGEGRFDLAFRAAPGDSIRLFYGPVEGSGSEARIALPQEIVGRVGSVDFVTLIYEGS